MSENKRIGRKPLGPGKSKGCRMLFEWINEKDLTYTKAGELLGYPKERISRYVNGVRKPEAKAMYKMFVIADIPMPAWLEN
jgi:plasmid maintenance system antidote protein VapI|tara:strand:- start:2165 stop:2407 length:243 start_codon:yes stop_codon:yes gene_type:complete